MEIQNNTDLAILTKLNELIERHGLKPYDCTADLKYDVDTDQTTLRFLTASNDPVINKKLDAMIDTIAGPEGMQDGTLAGGDKTIIDALDQALAKAPRRLHGR
jgi:hypothetical protein